MQFCHVERHKRCYGDRRIRGAEPFLEIFQLAASTTNGDRRSIAISTQIQESEEDICIPTLIIVNASTPRCRKLITFMTCYISSGSPRSPFSHPDIAIAIIKKWVCNLQKLSYHQRHVDDNLIFGGYKPIARTQMQTH